MTESITTNDDLLSMSSSTAAVHFEVTGCAAHSRITPLLARDWIDSGTKTKKCSPHFLWENAPRPETKEYRDQVRCYSHLPNGLSVLDSKWALARLFKNGAKESSSSSSLLAALPSHCFRGGSGFKRFCDKVGMLQSTQQQQQEQDSTSHGRFLDLLDTTSFSQDDDYPPAPHNLWVVKDDMSNGAGGIWMVNPDNAAKFLNAGPLIEEHRYVAQQYVWPPVLYGDKKCHVRVYGLFTADGRAFVHRKCFLHVANETFLAGNFQQDSVHITNCCANSHDKTKFAGEICADLTLEDESQTTDCGRPIVPLADYHDSIAASVAHLAENAFPFLKGGEVNGGFEYLGMDFILSKGGKAYMLEVNAPPSQDTATGLPHAENLHNAVLSDLISLWVEPRLTGVTEKLGGWKCVYAAKIEPGGTILPSKAVILNKIRWAIFERKTIKQEEEQLTTEYEYSSKNEHVCEDLSPNCIANFARLQFPYFASIEQPIFMESAGGAQVPYSVIDAMKESLSCRNRSVIGAKQKQKARDVARTLLGCSPQEHIYFGANATSLLQALAQQLSQTWQSGDEIILSTENHLANTTPWIQAAERVGATIKWWSVDDSSIDALLSTRTKLVALSHASNLLGKVRNVVELQNVQIVVDGVAAIPHVPAVRGGCCWYVVSCHKLFGPHLGILCGPSAHDGIEVGTVNYESCAGLIGLGEYFERLATFQGEQAASQSQTEHKDRRASSSDSLTRNHVLEAYRRISIVEDALVQHVMQRFQDSSSKVHILGKQQQRSLPLVAFYHDSISAGEIVEELANRKVVCRQGSFLSTVQLQNELGFENVVRLSLAHYNTISEIDFAMDRLEELAGW